MNKELEIALIHPLWLNHKSGSKYQMDDRPDIWEIAYYPIFEDGKTGEKYNEPRALVENITKREKEGAVFWSKEVPLRYLYSTIKSPN